MQLYQTKSFSVRGEWNLWSYVRLLSMSVLTDVIYVLPKEEKLFSSRFTNYFSSLSTVNADKLLFNIVDSDFFPRTGVVFDNVNIPHVDFLFDDKPMIRVAVSDILEEHKKSPHTYRPISLDEYMKRMSDIKLLRLDHSGFNLPYKKGFVHPAINNLREELKDKCLYHTFPKEIADEPWDFILPATREEIEGKTSLDYKLLRRPKVELVTFYKSSTPLIQFDIQVNYTFDKIVKMFPEGIVDDYLKNVWVYIANNYGVDICFVVNEPNEKDWSDIFSHTRI
jgi:hypothetical protein